MSQNAGRQQWNSQPRGELDHAGQWGSTDYESWGHSALVKAVMRGNPTQIAAVGHEWERVGRALNSHADALDQRLKVLSTKWSGPAFAQYHKMVVDVSAAARVLAAATLELRNLSYSNAEALAKAQRAIQALPPDPQATTALTNNWGAATVAGFPSARPVSSGLEMI